MHSETGAFHASGLYASFFCNLFVVIVELDEQTYSELTIVENRICLLKKGEKSNVCFSELNAEPLFKSRMIKEALTNGGHLFFCAGFISRAWIWVSNVCKRSLLAAFTAAALLSSRSFAATIALRLAIIFCCSSVTIRFFCDGGSGAVL